MEKTTKVCLWIIMILYGIDAFLITPIGITFFNAVEVGFMASRGYKLLGLPYFYLSFIPLFFIMKFGLIWIEKMSIKHIKKKKWVNFPIISGTIVWSALMIVLLVNNIKVILF